MTAGIEGFNKRTGLEAGRKKNAKERVAEERKTLDVQTLCEN